MLLEKVTKGRPEIERALQSKKYKVEPGADKEHIAEKHQQQELRHGPAQQLVRQKREPRERG